MQPKDKNKMLVDMLKGIKLSDAGYTPPKPKVDTIPCSTMNCGRTQYPTLYLNINNAPSLKGYEVGDEVLMVVKGEITSHSKSDSPNYSCETFDIKIKKIAC